MVRLRVKNQCIFGSYCGMSQDGRVKFLDEELGKIVLYPKSKLEITHNKDT